MLGSLTFIVCATYVVLCLSLFLFQSRLVYFPVKTMAASPDDSGLKYEDVWLETRDGDRVHGWLIPAAPGARTVLFFHGNAGNISHRLDSIQVFHRLGLQVLIIDYRGYGQSDGSPSEANTYEDAQAAWRFLTEGRSIAPNRIVLFGRSLGGSVAGWLAARVPTGGLMLESSFTSVPDMAAQVYPIFPVRWLARIQYDTRAQLAAVECPVLIAHSRNDELVPFSHSRELLAAVRTTGYFLEMRGGHNDGFLTTGIRYEQGIERFLELLDLPALGREITLSPLSRDIPR